MYSKNGTTFIELLVIVLVLGALAAIAIPRITRSANIAKENTCCTSLDILNSQIELYAVDNDSTYPASLATVTANAKYFPDGAPTCPKNGTFTYNTSTNRVTCNH